MTGPEQVETGERQLDGRGIAIFGRAGNQDEQHLGTIYPDDGWTITPAEIATFYRQVADEIDGSSMTGRHGDDDLDGVVNQQDPDWSAPDERDEHAVDNAECDQAQRRPDRWLGVTRDPDALAHVGRTIDGPVDEMGGPLHG